jgi:hypothetical protein
VGQKWDGVGHKWRQLVGQKWDNSGTRVGHKWRDIVGGDDMMTVCGKHNITKPFHLK